MSIKKRVSGLMLFAIAFGTSAAGSSAHVFRGYGVSFSLDEGYFAYLNDHPCALDEKTSSASVYSSGLFQVVVYRSGKVSLLKKGVYVGDLR